jgi:hypothetical protein
MIRNKLIATLAVVMLLSGCSTLSKDNNNSTHISSSSAEVVNGSDLKLPQNISLESIGKAFEEYVNYRLWFYPDESKAPQINFESYIRKVINAEVRMYESDPGSVYLLTELGNWLGKIINEDGFIYLDGFVKQDEINLYPHGNYEKVDDLTIKVKAPHKPNYGTSPRKDKMIQAAEKYAESLCEDFVSGTESELWRDAKIYIADFYEYENVVNVWFVRKDGYASNNPVLLTENNNEFQVQGVKGYSIQDVMKDEKNFFFENRQIGDAVKQFTCDF